MLRCARRAIGRRDRIVKMHRKSLVKVFTFASASARLLARQKSVGEEGPLRLLGPSPNGSFLLDVPYYLMDKAALPKPLLQG